MNLGFLKNALQVATFGLGLAQKVEEKKGAGGGAEKHELWQDLAGLGLPLVLESIGHDGSNGPEIIQLTAEIKDRVIRLQKLLQEKAA